MGRVEGMVMHNRGVDPLISQRDVAEIWQSKWQDRRPRVAGGDTSYVCMLYASSVYTHVLFSGP